MTAITATRRSLLQSATASAVLTSCTTTQLAAAPGRKPNIVLIITDDQGFPAVGAHGHPWLATPHLDALHGQSTRFERFLANTSQRDGELILSAPLGGEGRTTLRNNRTAVAVTFPARAEDAVESILVFVHEITGGLVASVVNDHTSPVERRGGVADRLVATGQVRAGAMLVQKAAPELLDAYVRYYMSQSGQTEFSLGALQGHFVLPAALATDLENQIDVVLGGI